MRHFVVSLCGFLIISSDILCLKKNNYGKDNTFRGCGITKYPSSCVDNTRNRVFGGEITQAKVIPWQALVEFSRNKKVVKCGGVLISPSFVLSAAHCFDNETWAEPMFIKVYLGLNKLEKRNKYMVERRVVGLTIHYMYNSETWYGDLALLQLKKPVKYSKGILPVCLPRDNINVVNKSATLSGFGKVSYGSKNFNLRSSTQKILPTNDQICIRSSVNNRPQQTQLCGYNPESNFCDGDSGGPLTININGSCTLIGIVSHNEECNRTGIAGIYIKVSKFKSWIMANINTSVLTYGNIFKNLIL